MDIAVRQLGWIFGAVIAVIAIVFAIHNHAEQAVDLWPLPFIIELPLYALVLIAVAAGFLIGAFLTWVSESKWRRLARKRKRQLATLDAEMAALRAPAGSGRDSLPAVTPPPGETLPPGAGS